MTKDPIYLQEEKIANQSDYLLENSSNIFRKFGLSTNQSKIYLCLTKMGPKTASQLSKLLELPRTETYHILKTLQVKGCVEIVHHKPFKFGAVSIEDFLERLINFEKSKIEKLENTLDMIKKFKMTNGKIDLKQIC
ncbi:MAG: hypothetical protein GTN35_01700 [Nitrososphaeria archaeon]|nr:hypothetical protein [Nitrosopumilaceae archaeon]NIP10387.1 hypothetical protein [Nitrosopumilaceae archaeon]NIP91114.1 hypothetical protein [Nitrososphaeria archaeon]NIS95066.1 hypothetical protein [Nitrosopumilaceae archaeon]